MKKIFFNYEGWVCERYPYDIQVDDENSFIEVSDEEFRKTFESKNNFAWRVKNNVLSMEQFEDISEIEITENLRSLREEICFPVINRGGLWHERLTADQQKELKKWYLEWLNVTNTKEIPKKPKWIN